METRRGRIPDALADSYEAYKSVHVTIAPDIFTRMAKFMQDEDRKQSWVVSRALDEFLKKRGY